jgi:hypothetical protein
MDLRMVSRQEDELEGLEKVVDQYTEGAVTLASKAGREKLLAGAA